jgi:hypothetical protein
MTFIRNLVICFLVFLALPQCSRAQKHLFPLSPVLKSKDHFFFEDSINKISFVLKVKTGAGLPTAAVFLGIVTKQRRYIYGQCHSC